MKKKEIKRRLKHLEQHVSYLHAVSSALDGDVYEKLSAINKAMEQRLGGVGPLTNDWPGPPIPPPNHEQLRRAGVPISVSRSSVPPLPTGFEPGWDCCDKNGDLYFVGPEPEGAEHGE